MFVVELQEEDIVALLRVQKILEAIKVYNLEESLVEDDPDLIAYHDFADAETEAEVNERVHPPDFGAVEDREIDPQFSPPTPSPRYGYETGAGPVV